MNEHVLKPVAVRTLIACVLLAAAWIFTVKPARAELHDQRLRFDTQSMAVETYLRADPDENHTLRTEANLVERVERFADAMTLHSSNASIFDQIEKTAAARSVRIHRTDPRSSVRPQSRPNRRRGAPAEPEITTDEFVIEFSGPYGGVASFVADLPASLGLIHIGDMRLARTASSSVRGVMTVTVYRVPDRSAIIPQPAETSDDA